MIEEQHELTHERAYLSCEVPFDHAKCIGTLFSEDPD